ncbi:hypothetical protein AB0O01_30035 [Streptomyces sp. NPDC093252]|uniref:hypothetical protein n=1 Tax=Streptomyces sp. NPDC093252 TaxID=3154980 RepID=UPI003423EE98
MSWLLDRSGRGRRVGDTGFEVGDAPVLETEVGPGSPQPFVEGAVAGRELTDSLLEGCVLGGDPLDDLLSPLGLQVAYMAEEFTDACPLSEDLGVGSLTALLAVQRAFAPGCVAFVVLLSDRPGAAFAGLSRGSGDDGSRSRLS